MPTSFTEKQIARLRERMAKLDRIVELAEKLPQLSRRVVNDVDALFDKLKEGAMKGKLKQAQTAWDNTKDRLTRISNKSRVMNRTMRAADHKLSEAFIDHPERLSEHLDERRIDDLLDRGLSILELQNALLESQLNEIHEIANEFEAIFETQTKE